VSLIKCLLFRGSSSSGRGLVGRELCREELELQCSKICVTRSEGQRVEETTSMSTRVESFGRQWFVHLSNCQRRC